MGKKFLESNTVCIWGMGYLGYTFALKLQAAGFNIKIYDIFEDHLNQFKKGRWPQPAQISAWSSTGLIPGLSWEKISLAKSAQEMVEVSEFHILCIPPHYKSGSYNENLDAIREIFARFAKSDREYFLMFQSASGPGSLQRHLIEPLKDTGLSSFHIATAFRSDWSIEEFLAGYGECVVSATDNYSEKICLDFLGLLGLKTRRVGGILEAEFLENCANALEFMVTAFLNQLSQSYPEIRTRDMSGAILEKCRFDRCRPGMGEGGFRMPQAVDHLIRESRYAEHLSLLKESGRAHMSSMMLAGEKVLRHGSKKALILGLTTQKDVTLSASLIIANMLLEKKIELFIHDPDYSETSLKNLLPGASWFELDGDLGYFDTVLILSDSMSYKMMDTDKIRKSLDREGVLILDAFLLWEKISFQNASYGGPGDGSMDFLR